ncbi:hypothetical protein PAXINDRAFT_17683 [Paxillus involutus ATCC 200175]|uniref:BTB domain-containing protein n=1 Tax=Paxillus involutus ATCC 200175 TaxID=664439 RepID=A0A0C9T0N2_PAXIN|nr:hypothetical protein PAXINDRAFT_17683 [Paxillus involutus ATCC 200175]
MAVREKEKCRTASVARLKNSLFDSARASLRQRVARYDTPLAFFSPFFLVNYSSAEAIQWIQQAQAKLSAIRCSFTMMGHTFFRFVHAGRYLFKVHESILSEKSEVFQDMFQAQNEVGALMIPITDGRMEAAPVVLPPTISKTAFELFFVWHPDSKKAPNDVVFQLLELSHMFFSNDVREIAIKEIDDRRTSIRPCHLISISMEYNIGKLFKYAFRRLVKARLDDLMDNEYTMMPLQLWAAILKAQSTLQVHRRIIACESPPMAHPAGCPDPDDCALDWHQLWWNGMGHSLLDGRNPQSYKDALKRFEELLLSDVGKVSPACLHSVMVTVRSGSAFHEEESFIERAAKKWADKLLK